MECIVEEIALHLMVCRFPVLRQVEEKPRNLLSQRPDIGNGKLSSFRYVNGMKLIHPEAASRAQKHAMQVVQRTVFELWQ